MNNDQQTIKDGVLSPLQQQGLDMSESKAVVQYRKQKYAKYQIFEGLNFFFRTHWPKRNGTRKQFYLKKDLIMIQIDATTG